MRYIVWDMISPWDGYKISEWETWEQAITALKHVVTPEQYQQFLEGKIYKIVRDDETAVFITTVPLVKPVEEVKP